VHIIAFDPSKCTGWALRDISRDDSSIRCGLFEMPKEADHYYVPDQLALKVRALIDAEKKAGRKPDFAILEEQAKAGINGSQADSMIYAWATTAAIVAVLANFGIPYATIPAATWRVAFFGSGYKPPFKLHKLKKPDPRTGKTERTEYLWKDACISECERRQIVLPSGRDRHNAAEACALALCAQSDKTKIHAGRYRAAWTAIRDTKFKSSATSDLFGAAA
jgi:hypothetical protein